MSTLSACDTVTSNNCVGATRERGDGTRLLACYRCGANTCEACSSLQPCTVLSGGSRTVRKVRTCDTCLEQDRTDGPARVLLRRYHEAGYPEITLEDARGYVASEARYLDTHRTPTTLATPDQPRQRSRRRPACTR